MNIVDETIKLTNETDKCIWMLSMHDHTFVQGLRCVPTLSMNFRPKSFDPKELCRLEFIEVYAKNLQNKGGSMYLI